MSVLDVCPQPWHDEEVRLDEAGYMKHATTQEAEGKRLVVQTYINAYQDFERHWWLDYVLLTDYRTGEQVFGYDPSEGEPEFNFDAVYIVRNQIKWSE